MFPSGADLSSPERDLLRIHEAAWALIDALGNEPAFWEHSRQVAESASPAGTARELSLRYCQGARRDVLTELLVRAAVHPGLKDSPAWQQRLFLGGVSLIKSTGGQGPKRNAVGGPFMAPLLRASYLVAAQGAGRCLAWNDNGSPCQSDAAEGAGSYCRRHDVWVKPEPGRVERRVGWEREREEIVKRLFKLARPLIVGATPDAATARLRARELA